MKKFLLIAVAVSSLLFASMVYAGGVTDNNNGNKGYILVSTGENNGTNSIGHWTDPSFLKGDTGQAGRDGATGQAGYTPIKNVDYFDGMDGKAGLNGTVGQAGYTPIKGIDYNDGKDGAGGGTGSQGETGQNGKTPVKGVDYNDGLNGTDGKTPIKNIDYFDGINGLNGKDVDPKTVNELNNKIDNNSNRINKLEESQYIVGGVIRIKSTKKWDVDLFADYSTNRQMIDRSGIRFTYKVGESYQDLEMKKLENRIKALENK
jgi:hypothetical protein